MVGALERLNLFVAVSEHAGGGRKQLEVLPRQRR